MIKQYDATKDKWLSFPAITNGKLPMASYGSGYALMIQNGAAYVVLTGANGIGTWRYKP